MTFKKSNGFDIVVNPYNNKESSNRKGMLLRGPWRSEYLDAYRSEGIRAVYLNSSKGWSDFDLSFLSDLSDLEELGIIAPHVTGIETLSGLTQLRQLEFTAVTKGQVAFNRLPCLEKCYLYWWPGASSIFQCISLQDVTLDGLRSLPEDWYQNWRLLSRLAIQNSPIKSIPSLSAMVALTKLELANLKTFDDFSPIGDLRSLRWLSISGCKRLQSIEFTASLTALEILLLEDDGEIASLSPLQNLHALKALSFMGSTVVVDGDLKPLTQLPHLSMLGFGPQRHYTHKLLKAWSWKNIDLPDTLLALK